MGPLVILISRTYATMYYMLSTRHILYSVLSNFIEIRNTGPVCMYIQDTNMVLPASARPCAIWDICLKRILNPNLAKSRWQITHASVYQSFWNFTQNTVISLPCFVQNFEPIGRLKRMLWTNVISRDLSLRRVSDGYLILHSTPCINSWFRCQSISYHNADYKRGHIYAVEFLWLFWYPVSFRAPEEHIQNGGPDAILRCLAPVNTLRPRQNGRHLADDVFNCIFLSENLWI